MGAQPCWPMANCASSQTQVDVFGLRWARLDVRQHSAWHEAAMADVLGKLGVCDDYAGLDEAEQGERC